MDAPSEPSSAVARRLGISDRWYGVVGGDGPSIMRRIARPNGVGYGVIPQGHVGIYPTDGQVKRDVCASPPAANLDEQDGQREWR